MSDENLQPAAAEQNPSVSPGASPTPDADSGTGVLDTLGSADQSAQPGLPDTLGEVPDAQQQQVNDDPSLHAPESYEAFKSGEVEYSAEDTQAFSEVAKSLDLTQEKAQSLFETMEPVAQKVMQNKLSSYSKKWAEQLPNDPEFGGAQYAENLAIAKAGYQHFVHKELAAVFKASGLSNHPEVVRLSYRLGKTLQQDKGVVGGASAPAPRRRYPNSNMVVDE